MISAYKSLCLYPRACFLRNGTDLLPYEVRLVSNTFVQQSALGGSSLEAQDGGLAYGNQAVHRALQPTVDKVRMVLSRTGEHMNL